MYSIGRPRWRFREVRTHCSGWPADRPPDAASSHPGTVALSYHRPWPTTRSPPFAWHPEPDLIGVGDADVPAMRSRRAGEAAWGGAGLALRPRLGPGDGPARRLCRPPRDVLRAEPPAPAPAPVEPATLDARPRRVPTRVAPHNLERLPPALAQLLHPAAARRVGRGRAARAVAQQGVDVWHAGPLATFVEEEVVRWLCDLVGYGEDSFGLLHVGGVMANFLAMALVRDVRLAALRGADRAATRRGARGRPGLHVRPDPLLDRPRARRAGLPARDARRPAGRRPLPPPRRARRRGDRRATGRAGLTPVAICAVAGSTNTGSVDLVPELADVAEREGLWLHVDAAYGAAARLSARDAGRVPGLERPTRSPSTRTSGSSRPTTSAGLLVRDGALRRRSAAARVLPRRRGAAPRDAARRRRRPRRPRPAELLQARVRGHPPLACPQAWDRGSTSGRAGSAGSSSETIDVAASSPPLRRERRLRGLPPEPALSVVCFRHLPGGAVAAAAMDRALDDHQDRAPGGARGRRRRLALDDAPARLDLLRAGIVNSHTTPADIDRLLATLRSIAAEAGPRRIDPRRPLDAGRAPA